MNLYEVLARARNHTTTEEDAEWLENEFDQFALMLECHNAHYRDLLAAWEENQEMREENDRLRRCYETAIGRDTGCAEGDVVRIECRQMREQREENARLHDLLDEAQVLRKEA